VARSSTRRGACTLNTFESSTDVLSYEVSQAREALRAIIVEADGCLVTEDHRTIVRHVLRILELADGALK
jgi:hypothetical protein